MKKVKIEVIETEYKTPWALIISVGGQVISDDRYKTKELAEQAIKSTLANLVSKMYTALETLSNTSNKVRLDMYQSSDVKMMNWMEK